MSTVNSHFRRNLVIVLVIMFLLTQVAIFYPAMANDPGLLEWWMVLLNMLVVSLPLVLLYGSVYLAIVAWREHSLSGQVEPRLARFIHWTPRVAVILIGAFMGLFSLDVFEIEASPLELLGGFLMHNIPTIAMIVLLAFAWKRPAVGAVAFLIVGVVFAFLFVRSIFALPNLVLFVLPVLLIAGLFYIDWKWLGTSPVHPAQ